MAKKPARTPLGRSRRAELNVIDYTLAKRALLRDSQMGLQSVNDLCDAHPELIRAAALRGRADAGRLPGLRQGQAGAARLRVRRQRSSTTTGVSGRSTRACAWRRPIRGPAATWSRSAVPASGTTCARRSRLGAVPSASREPAAVTRMPQPRPTGRVEGVASIGITLKRGSTPPSDREPYAPRHAPKRTTASGRAAASTGPASTRSGEGVHGTEEEVVPASEVVAPAVADAARADGVRRRRPLRRLRAYHSCPRRCRRSRPRICTTATGTCSRRCTVRSIARWCPCRRSRRT